MDSVVVSHQKYLKNHQKKEADSHLIKLMVLPSKKLKKLEFRLAGKIFFFLTFHVFLTSFNSTFI